MPKTRRLILAFASALGGVLALAGPASAQGGTTVGTLTCNVAGGFGFVIGSSRAITCTFAGPGGHYEHYTGRISKFGVDIGYLRGGILVWNVIAPTSGPLAPGVLAGSYGGVTAGATVGVGIGAHALVGGSNRSFTLQPLSIEGNRGLNVAAGIAGMTLTPAS